ncbi:hypothetical protein ES703_68446 [subsurface metagenome]
MEIWEFMQKQSLPYDAKLTLAKLRAREFYDKLDGQVFCSVGGLDSITLLFFLRKYVSKTIPGVSVSSLEDKSIQKVHSQLENMIILKPEKSKIEVIKELGYPVISKNVADKIEQLQNPSEKNATIRHAIITGDTGKQGGYKYSRFMKLADRWQKLFVEQEAPFKVSGKCCYYMKEKPCDRYSRETKSFVYMALMASEHGRREISLMKHGCNYYGKTVTRSCPFAIFNKNDLLRLALELEVPVPAIYGDIVELPDGRLTTTKATRTGCTMCGFGIHMEKRPHRFDRLRESNAKEWHFWMYDQGWGKVLDYIGVEWRNHQLRLI